jgi:8-oxo-dGTP pyrophosphatase MutT (NUDIX family)
MVRRGKRAAFMADAYVFPGGRVDPGEPFRAAGAAAREAFEEASVLLAVTPDGQLIRTDGEAWVTEARRALHAKTAHLNDLLAVRGLRLAVDVMVPFARWVTPSSEPRRYDTWFFLARMPEGQTVGHDEIEVSEHRWGTPAELLAANERGEIKLPPPTFWHLSDLLSFATVDETLAWGRKRPRRAVRPKLVPVGETLAVVLPWDAEFASLPGEGDSLPPDDILAGPLGASVTRFLLTDGRWVPTKK